MLGQGYQDRAAQAVRASVRHIWLAEVLTGEEEPTPLNIIAGSVTFSEPNTAHARATLVVAFDEEVMKHLDPRTRPHIAIYAGYEYSDGYADVWPLCRVEVISRTIRRSADTLTVDLQCVGMEYALTRQVLGGRETAVREGSDVGEKIAALLASRSPMVFPVDNRLSFEPMGPTEYIEPDPDGDVWAYITELALSRNAVVYTDGVDAWTIREIPNAFSEPVAQLATGEGGVITEWHERLDVAGFFNSVVVRAEWSDSTGSRVSMRNGPYGTAAIGSLDYVHEMSGLVSSLQASRIADALLKRGLSMGRMLNITVANSHYWVRPWDTLEVTLDYLGTRKYLVSEIVFDFNGSMMVTLRNPEPVSANNYQLIESF